MRQIGLIVIAIFFSLQTPLFAYLDPGSGGVFVQLILGGIAGLMVILKLYWRKAVAFFTGKKVEDEQTSEDFKSEKLQENAGK